MDEGVGKFRVAEIAIPSIWVFAHTRGLYAGGERVELSFGSKTKIVQFYPVFGIPFQFGRESVNDELQSFTAAVRPWSQRLRPGAI